MEAKKDWETSNFKILPFELWHLTLSRWELSDLQEFKILLMDLVKLVMFSCQICILLWHVDLEKFLIFLQVGITYTNVLKIIYDCHCYYRENVILWWRSLNNLKWSNISIVPRSRLIFPIVINSFFSSSWSVQCFVFCLMFLSLFMSRESIIDMVYNDLFLIFKMYYNLFCLWLILPQLEIKVIFTVFFCGWGMDFLHKSLSDNSLSKTTSRLGFCFRAREWKMKSW